MCIRVPRRLSWSRASAIRHPITCNTGLAAAPSRAGRTRRTTGRRTGKGPAPLERGTDDSADHGAENRAKARFAVALVANHDCRPRGRRRRGMDDDMAHGGAVRHDRRGTMRRRVICRPCPMMRLGTRVVLGHLGERGRLLMRAMAGRGSRPASVSAVRSR